MIQNLSTAQGAKLADKLETLADGLTSKINDKLAPMRQNFTPKRGRQDAQNKAEGRHMERAQRAMLALAELHRAGCCPAILQGYKTKTDILAALYTTCDSSGGYYSWIDSGKYRDETEPAKALQQLLEPKTDEQRQRKAASAKADELTRALADLRGCDIDGFFPTPADLATRMAELLDVRPGMRVLEPSAGIGSLADAVRELEPSADILCIERHHSLCDILERKGYNLAREDFLEWAQSSGKGTFDRVIINPPFEGSQAPQHILTAFQLLAPGGILVALGPCPMFHKSALINKQLGAYYVEFGTYRTIVQGAFKGAAAFRSTDVACVLFVLRKPGGETPVLSQTQTRTMGKAFQNFLRGKQ